MDNLIPSSGQQTIHYSNLEFQKALQNLEQYDFDLSSRSSELLKNGKGPIQSKDFSGEYLNRTFLTDAQFEKSIFDYATLTGSIFTDGKFISCSFKDAVLESCDFLNVRFEKPSNVKSVAFGKSTFLNCSWRNIKIEGCTFTDSLFEDTLFANTDLSLSTFENALFRNCTFQNSELWNLNLDFSEFVDVNIENSIISLTQVPYTFGLLQHIFNANDTVYLADQKDKKVSAQKYAEKIIPSLIVYHSRMHNYFPLANLYFATGQCERAAKALNEGLRMSLVQKDFRMIKYYCKLVERSQQYPTHERHALYHNIIAAFPSENLSGMEYHNFCLNIDAIRTALFDNGFKPQLSIMLESNIESNEENKIAAVVRRLYCLSDMICNEDADITITLSKNSPISFSINLLDALQNLNLYWPAIACMAALTTAEVAKKIAEIRKLAAETKAIKTPPEAIVKEIESARSDFRANNIYVYKSGAYLANASKPQRLLAKKKA